jgi:hypothetical protein
MWRRPCHDVLVGRLAWRVAVGLASRALRAGMQGQGSSVRSGTATALESRPPDLMHEGIRSRQKNLLWQGAPSSGAARAWAWHPRRSPGRLAHAQLQAAPCRTVADPSSSGTAGGMGSPGVGNAHRHPRQKTTSRLPERRGAACRKDRSWSDLWAPGKGRRREPWRQHTIFKGYGTRGRQPCGRGPRTSR